MKYLTPATILAMALGLGLSACNQATPAADTTPVVVNQPANPSTVVVAPGPAGPAGPAGAPGAPAPAPSK